MNEAACCVPGQTVPAPDPEADEALAALAKAIAHPVRVQIVRMLAQIDTCVCGEIVEALPLAQSTVSQHLKVLKDAGLIRSAVDGARTSYCVDPAGLRRLRTLVAAL